MGVYRLYKACMWIGYPMYYDSFKIDSRCIRMILMMPSYCVMGWVYNDVW
ncbi:hypothetical protein [Bacillus phage BUCT083]|nr:hypothetical protein [Bacillus phage BUCT083]